MILHLFCLLFVIDSEVCPQLIFSDEFDGSDSLDLNKWDVINEENQCKSKTQLNCYANNRNNIQVIDGNLVLAAIRQNHLDKEYTTPYIYTKQKFTYGRFEVRAALPRAKMLKSWIRLENKDNSWIDIFENTQTQKLNPRIYFNRDSKRRSDGHNMPIEESLSDFNTYVIDWTEFEVTWFLNEQILYKFNITREISDYGTQFIAELELAISLGVGGNSFQGQTLNAKDVEEWNCSLLIIDYIRVYQNNSVNSEVQLDKTSVPSSQICNTVMPSIKSKMSNWELIFSEEFNESESIDRNKWVVYSHQTKCDFQNQLNCDVDHPDNIRLINGTLALAAIRRKHLNKYYTSPYITTKQSFTYGRFEMRVALPNGKLLRPWIALLPVKNTVPWPKDGQIDILINEQMENLNYGVTFVQKFYPDGADIKFYNRWQRVVENLNDFNTYVLEWTHSEISWFFNGRHLYTVNTTGLTSKYYNIFDEAFQITITLAIGGQHGDREFFSGHTLYEKDVLDWKCSLLILDYIRVYRNVPEQTTSLIPFHANKIASTSICDNIMPLIRPKIPFWELIFTDDFTDRIITENKWDFTPNLLDCQGFSSNCEMDLASNIRLIDGSLVLFLNKRNNPNFPVIKSKSYFTYGRFEIRAALPLGMFLNTTIYLEPTEKYKEKSNVWSIDGQIDILSNIDLKGITYGFHFAFEEREKYIKNVSNDPFITESLFNFHTYVLEWTETEMRWMFDGNHLFKVSIHKELQNNYNPFDKPFRLVLGLNVVTNASLEEQFEEASSLERCPLLILDYVRVYKESDRSINTIAPIPNKRTRSEICQDLLSHYNSRLGQSSNNIIIIISVSVVILTSLILLFICLFVKLKTKNYIAPNLRNDGTQENTLELYDEILNPYVYSEPYQSTQFSKDLYTGTDLNDSTYVVMRSKYSK